MSRLLAIPVVAVWLCSKAELLEEPPVLPCLELLLHEGIYLLQIACSMQGYPGIAMHA
jgi:hypothetical protein